jgi:hypothetical protein
MLAELGQHRCPHELTARAHIKVGSLTVELAAVLGYQPHADEIAIDEIRKFGVDENAHKLSDLKGRSLPVVSDGQIDHR